MLATTSNTQPRRKSAALEVMLSSLETAGDLLSGSECSSLAASPVHEEVFTFRPPSSKRKRGPNEESRLRPTDVEPVDVLRGFIDRMPEPHAAKELFAGDAKVDVHSVMVCGEDKKEFDDLLASCSRCDIQIDGIFACGEDVAAFGHFAYSDGLGSFCRDVHFSIWACVNVAREKIVELRWLDQFVQFKGGSTDGR